MTPHDFSHAQPKRLFLDKDEHGVPFHVLSGERLEPGTLLLLQLADGTWIPGVYDWQPPLGAGDPHAPPRFRVHLTNPDNKQQPLTVEFELPDEAVLRVHPAWRRIMNPRPPRNPRGRRTS